MMTVRTVIPATLIAALLTALPVQAHELPACTDLDERVSNNFDIGPNFLVSNGDLKFKEDGKVIMLVTQDGELHLNGQRIDLTPHAQKLVNAYYQQMDLAADEFSGMAGDAARLGISAAGTAIFRLLTGNMDAEEFEQQVEAKALQIEARANRACTHLQEIERIEMEMTAAIPGFQPVMFADKESI